MNKPELTAMDLLAAQLQDEIRSFETWRAQWLEAMNGAPGAVARLFMQEPETIAAAALRADTSQKTVAALSRGNATETLETLAVLIEFATRRLLRGEASREAERRHDAWLAGTLAPLVARAQAEAQSAPSAP